MTYHPTWDEMTADRRSIVLDSLRFAGIDWLRVDVSWAEFQPVGPGQFDETAIEEFDSRMQEISRRGFKVLLMFYWAPRWATGTDAMNGRPRDPVAFGQAAAWAAQRWGQDIEALEIWNEPDLPQFWADSPAESRVGDFAKLLVATSTAVRRVAPDLTLIAGGTSRVDERWWQRLLRQPGVATSVDAIGVHPYTVPSNLGPDAADNGKPWRVRHLRAMAAVSRRYDLPVWITEFGWSTGQSPDGVPSYELGVTANQQARYLTDALEVFGSYPWIAASFWYTDIDHNTGSAFFNGFGLLTSSAWPKPAFWAMRCAASSACGP